jgi:hypothetical protein
MTKYSAKGTLLQRSIASVFTTIAGFRSVNGPDAEVQFFDGTALDSGVSVEDGELTEHTTPGSVSGEAFYDPADSVHQLMTDDLAAGGAYADYRIKLPDGTEVIAFNGSVSRWSPKAAVRDGLMADAAIKLRSVATYPTSA